MKEVLFLSEAHAHQPGFAIPRKFERKRIRYEFDVSPPPFHTPDEGWSMFLHATHPDFPQLFPSSWNGPRRPTADMEKRFLRTAFEGTDRFFEGLAKGLNYYAAVVHSQAKRTDPMAHGTVLLPSGRKETIPWLANSVPTIAR